MHEKIIIANKEFPNDCNGNWNKLYIKLWILPNFVNSNINLQTNIIHATNMIGISDENDCNTSIGTLSGIFIVQPFFIAKEYILIENIEIIIATNIPFAPSHSIEIFIYLVLSNKGVTIKKLNNPINPLEILFNSNKFP